MKFKREIMAIILIICVLFTISSISAADSGDEAIGVANESVELTEIDVANENNLAKSNDDVEILSEGETDEGDFAALNTKISTATSGTTVYLNNNYVYDLDNDIITNGIDINNGLTIDGNGHCIDAKGQTNIFNVNYQNGVTFKNITFLNAVSSNGASVLHCVEDAYYVNVDNCTFINNTGYYGSIYIFYGWGSTIKNSNFIKNRGTVSGAILWMYYGGTIDKCIFLNNTGSTSSIYWAVYYNNAVVSNSIFLNNKGHYDVYYDNQGKPLYLNNNWFGNTIYNYDNRPNVSPSGTLNNWYFLDYELDNENGKVTLLLNKLYENEGVNEVGSCTLPSFNFTIKSDELNLNKNVTLDNEGKATIEYDVVDGYSIIVSYKGFDILTIDSSYSLSKLDNLINIDPNVDEIHLEHNYEFNSVIDSGFTCINLDRTLTIDGKGLDGECHYIDASGHNIFKFNDESNIKNLVLKNIRFLNANGENGAVVYFKGNKIEIINCTFESNDAESEGDAVYIAGINEDSSIDQCTFINNKGTGSVACINSGAVEFDITNSIFLNNTGLNVKGNGNVVANHNWFGHNALNYDDDSVAKVSGVSLDNCLFLNIIYDVENITVSLNNLNDGTTYDGYSLPLIRLNVNSENLTVANSITIGQNGKSELSYIIKVPKGSLTVNYEDFSYTSQIDFIDDGSFTALQVLISYTSRNIVNLERNYTYNPDKDSDLSDGITFTKNMLIKGNNKKIDANGMARIFDIDYSITFRDLILVNGYSSQGGVVYNSGANGRFTNCTFINNRASSGGVAYNKIDNTLFLFEKCTFINNRATNGGVINNYRGVANFKDSIFENNYATSAGGVYCTEYYGYYMIENCTFRNNSAKMGAVIKSDTGSDYDEYIKNSTFIANKVTGIDSTASTYSVIFSKCPTIDMCTFVNNTGSSAIIYSSSYGDNLIVQNSIFLNNTARYVLDGGASSKMVANYNWFGNTVNNTASDEPNVNHVNLNNWLYLDAKLHATYADVYLNKLYVKSGSSTFDYNLPKLTLNVNSTTLNLECDNVTLDDNGQARIMYSMDSDYGALTVSYEKVSLTKENTAGDFDVLQDLIDLEEGDLLILNCDYAYIENVDSITGGIIISKNITIDGNGSTIDAKGKSRIFDVQATGVTFKNIIFVNASYAQGSAINLQMDNTEPIEFNVINCTFYNNTATSGTIYMYANEGTYNIRDSNFINNTASDFGGAIYINTKNAEFSLFNSTFIGNKAENAAGALYVETDGTADTIDKCLFKENVVSTDSSSSGSAIYWKTANDSGNVVKNSIFLSNSKNKNNRYVFVLNSSDVNINENWWGTNAQNKHDEFDSGFTNEIVPTSWLYINATANHRTVHVGDNSTVKYLLQLYDQTNGEMEYDNSKLPKVILPVSSEYGHGTVDKTSVGINEEFNFTATRAGGDSILTYTNGNTMFEFDIMVKEYCAIKLFVDNPFTMYCNQHLSFNNIAKRSDGYSLYARHFQSSNSSVIGIKDGTSFNNYEINAHSSGVAIITITYDGAHPEYYDDLSVDLIVNVLKVPMVINVTSLDSNEIDMYASEDLTINITLQVDDIHKDYTGNKWNQLDYDIEGDYNEDYKFISYYKGSPLTSSSEAIVNGTGEIRAVYPGTAYLTLFCNDDYFDCENVTIKVNVFKKPTAIELDHADALEFKVDNTSKINATVINGTGSPALTYESSDTNIVQITNQQTGEFKVVGNGTAIITVKYPGNLQYNESTKAVTIIGTKYDTTTTVTSSKELSLRIDEKSQIEAGLNPNVGDLEYISSNESVASVSSTGLITAHRNGTVTITVRYPGDRKYEKSEDTISLTVSKNATQITADDKTLKSTDENIPISATLNITDDYTLSYSSSNESVVTVSPNGNLTAVGGGEAQITITYPGSEKYLHSTKTINVVVQKLATEILADTAISTNYLKQITLNPSVVADGKTIAGATLTYFIDGEEISNPFTVDRVDEFNVTVKYAENPKFKASELNITVNSDKADNIIKVIVDDASYPDNITIKLNATVAGTYSVDINGTVYEVVANGTGKSVKLSAGIYYANITGYTSEYYYGRTTNDTFTVEKDTNNVHVIVENKYLPGSTVINVTADIDGTYKVVLNDTAGTEVLVEVSGGEGSNTVLLPAGKYEANTTFADHQNYTVNIQNTTFDVLKSDNHITVNVEDGTYPNNVTVTVTADVDGTYSVDINGTVHEIAANGEGKSIKLAAGRYYANISGYSSDDYIGVTANDTFTIAKSVNDVAVIVEDKYLPGNVTVKVTADVDGIYTVDVNGTEVDVNVVAGEGTNTTALPAGLKYEAKTTFADHQNYTVSITNSTFDVNKSDILLEIVINEIIYGENVNGTIITNVSGTYTLKIADADPFAINLNSGSNKFTREILLPVATGYHAEVSIAESDNYNAKSAETTFEVDQTGTDFNASSSKDEYVYGEEIILKIELPNDATGNVTFKYIDESYIGEISDVTQTKEFKMPIVKASSYTIQARYNGDNNYKPRTKTIDEFKVVPAVNHITVTVDDVTYPNVATVKVTADVEGIYTIKIGKEEYKVVANDTNGKYVKLAAGTYDAKIIYSNENYTAVTQNDTFTVNKGINIVIVNVDDAVLPGDVTVKVTATLAGTYEVDINGTKVNVTVESNGVGTNTTILPAGNDYVAKITQAGDKNYTAIVTNATFSVLKSDNKITVSVVNATYPGEVTVRVTADIGGNYTVDINGTEYEIAANGTGKAIKLAAGNYYANVTGYSSDNYTGVITNATFTVGKKQNSVNVTFNDTVLPGNVTVNVEAGMDGIYTIDINGTEVVVNVESGAGTNNVSLPAGKNYTAAVTYQDSQNYTLVVNANPFDVEKSINRIKVTVESVDYPNEVIVNVTADVLGTYTVDINGTKYDVEANKTGKAVKLAAGSYFANITGYASDDYIGVIENATFNVNKISPQISADNLEIDAKGNETIVVNNRPSDASLSFESSDESIATVDSNGKVTAIKSGKATITVRSTGSQNYSDDSIEVNVTVKKISAGITVDESSFEIDVNANKSIIVNKGEFDGTITFESSNSSVAAVDADGKLTGIIGGNATITVRANGSDVYDDEIIEVNVTVKKISAGITVDESSFEIDVKSNKSIIVNKGEFDGTITFESSNSSVAAVDADGKVTGIAGGSATITVNATGSAKYNDTTLEVTVAVNKIAANLNASDLIIEIDASQNIIIKPDDFGGIITYESNNKSIATVDANGKVTGISQGNATITITATDSAIYNDDSITINVTVNKIQTDALQVPNSIEIDVDGSEDIIASDEYGRDLTYSSSNESIATVDSDGHITPVSGGSVNITVTASEDEKHQSESKNITVVINKIQADIDVEDSLDLDVKEIQQIEVYGDFDGIITYESNDTSVAAVDAEGKVTGVSAGNASIRVLFTNSSTYLDDEFEVKVTVSRISAELDVDPKSLELIGGEKTKLFVSTEEDYDGQITFTSSNSSIVTVDKNGVITAVNDGTAFITVNASQTGKYLGDEKEIAVKVGKLAYEITLDIADITAREDASAIITTTDAGILNVTITKGPEVVKSENVNVDGYMKYVISGLGVGTYRISAKYDGSVRYNESEITKEFTVKPIYNYDFLVDVEDTVVGKTTNATILLPVDATGTIRIGSDDYNVSREIALPVQNTSGRNSIVVEYLPDGNSDYGENAVIAYYDVFKMDSEIKINIKDDIKAGESVEITIDTYDGADISVYVDGEKQTVKDGKVTVTPMAGTHTVIANVAENERYVALSANRTFEVTKTAPTLTINSSDVKVGGKATIDINITDSATGKVIVNVNGTEYSVDLDVAKLISVVLDNAGKYAVSAKYLGDDIFDQADSNVISIEAVEKDPANIKVEIPESIKVGVTVVINVTSDNDNITVEINGEAQALKDGKVEYAVDKAGSYSIVVTAGENPDYAKDSYATTFTADKNPANIKVEVPENVKVGDTVVINVTSDNDNITVEINGEVQAVKDGKVEYAVNKSGSYSVVVTAGENPAYAKDSYSTAFAADKNPASVKIILPESIEIGKDIEIAVESYDGADILVYVDGIAQTLTDNRLTIKATAGTHNVIAEVDETEKYMKASANETFTVEKLVSLITVKATNTKVGENTTVSVNVTEKATGIVIVNVAGKEYSISLENSTELNVLMTAGGKFNVTARYLGDDIFNASESTVTTIEVAEKETPKVDVKLPEIKAGETGNISLNIPNATGLVYVIVDGKAQTASLDESGSAIIPIDNVSAGNHTITVIYTGDENNDMAIQSQSFNIGKKASDVNVTVDDIELGKDSQIAISVPNATGNVSVIIDGVEVSVPLDENGNVNFTVPSLAADKHSIVVVYPGDDTHAPAVITKQINATAKSSELKDIVVSGDGTITAVLVDENGDGIANANITYKINGESKTTSTNDNGEIAIEASPNSVVEIDYVGDSMTLPANTTIELKNLAPVRLATEIRANDYTTYSIDVYAGESGGYFKVQLVDQNGKPLANKEVKIGFNGVVYNKTTDENGWTKLQINLRKAGEYTFAVTFLGDDSYDASFVIKKITVNKKPTSISAASKSYKASAKTKSYTVILKTIKGSSSDGKAYIDSGKKITLKLNGKTYSAKTNSKGQATFKLSITKVGRFVAVLSYEGDDGYLASSTKTKISIK